jgi:Uma2 family endonuclease
MSLMISTTPQPKIPLAALSGERRVVFRNLNWQAYQQILQALGEQRSSRITYDRGTLEITMPLEEHETLTEWIGLFIRILVEDLNLKLKSIRSTTLEYPQLDRGAEPDNAYYIQNQPRVAGRKVDFSQDPPPDLIVEVDITHTHIDKNQLYAGMGVPEFWRYNGQELRIYQLQNQAYIELETSPTLSNFPKTRLYEFLTQFQADEVAASKALRSWVQSFLQSQQA